MTPVYVVGDVHGRLAFLQQALDWIAADGGEAAQIVFLGDLTDRGRESREVIQLILDGIAGGRPWRVVKGNHDRLLTRFLDDGRIHDARIKSGISWLHARMGGVETLASYGVLEASQRPLDEVLEEARAKVPQEHHAFLEGLPLFIEQNELLFVHAGIRPVVPLKDQEEDDLVWIRDDFLNHKAPHPWLIVHGHTAIDIPFHYGNRVNLDGGAGYGRPIYPAVFEGRECWLLDESGRLALVP